MRQLCVYLVFSLIPIVSLAAEICPHDFNSFLTRFESEKQFQEQNTHFPLMISFVDTEAIFEPRTVLLKIKSITDPLYPRASYPSRNEQVTTPFKKEITFTPSIGYQVQFTKPDTDYSFLFTFKQVGSCWKLVKFEDYSL
jgi:hypothetical protein